MTGLSNSLVSVLLHHSGSTSSTVDATYGGFSRFAQAERRRSSSTIVELAQLDDPDEPDYGPGHLEMDYEAGSLGGGGLSRLLGPPPRPATLCDELGNWVTAVDALHAILPAGAAAGGGHRCGSDGRACRCWPSMVA